MSDERESGLDCTSCGDDDAGFLARWSRRKSEARRAAVVAEAEDAAPEPSALPPDPVQEDDFAPDTEPLPTIDSLTENSDYSAFLSPKVSRDVRRLALRKLFKSPKFNVCDGLDVYCGDYTKFELLGDIVTADMRHQLARAAEVAARMAGGDEPVDIRADTSVGETAADSPPPRADDDDTEPA